MSGLLVSFFLREPGLSCFVSQFCVLEDGWGTWVVGSEDGTEATLLWSLLSRCDAPMVTKADNCGVVLTQAELGIGWQQLVEVHQVIHQGELLPRGFVLRCDFQRLLKLVLGTLVLAR